MNGVAIL